MQNKKYHLDYVEFYITNVCNFNCSNCNRFNNYHFSGQQTWDDYKSVYEHWSKIISFDKIGILGGEPLLNPTINEWINGIANLWKNTQITIVTNGTELSKVKNLYNTVKNTNTQVEFEINLHNASRKDYVINDAKNFLNDEFTIETVYTKQHKDNWNTVYNNIKDVTWPECSGPDEFPNLPKHIQNECTDVFNFNDKIFNKTLPVKLSNNNVSLTIDTADAFNLCTVIENDGIFSVYDSNPNKALDVCYSKRCHHFIKGKLYKCGVVGILPMFYEQFHFDIILLS